MLVPDNMAQRVNAVVEATRIRESLGPNIPAYLQGISSLFESLNRGNCGGMLEIYGQVAQDLSPGKEQFCGISLGTEHLGNIIAFKSPEGNPGLGIAISGFSAGDRKMTDEEFQRLANQNVSLFLYANGQYLCAHTKRFEKSTVNLGEDGTIKLVECAVARFEFMDCYHDNTQIEDGYRLFQCAQRQHTSKNSQIMFATSEANMQTIQRLENSSWKSPFDLE